MIDIHFEDLLDDLPEIDDDFEMTDEDGNPIEHRFKSYKLFYKDFNIRDEGVIHSKANKAIYFKECDDQDEMGMSYYLYYNVKCRKDEGVRIFRPKKPYLISKTEFEEPLGNYGLEMVLNFFGNHYDIDIFTGIYVYSVYMAEVLEQFTKCTDHLVTVKKLLQRRE